MVVYSLNITYNKVLNNSLVKKDRCVKKLGNSLTKLRTSFFIAQTNQKTPIVYCSKNNSYIKRVIIIGYYITKKNLIRSVLKRNIITYMIIED